VFKDNIPIIKYENRDVASKLLAQIQADLNGGKKATILIIEKITWGDFLKIFKMALAKSFQDKIEIFFYVFPPFAYFKAFDIDHNRMFDWEEVRNICISCLSQMFS